MSLTKLITVLTALSLAAVVAPARDAPSRPQAEVARGPYHRSRGA